MVVFFWLTTEQCYKRDTDALRIVLSTNPLIYIAPNEAPPALREEADKQKETVIKIKSA